MAFGAGNSDDEELITAINVIPLVDIVLVLLIILMVTANYIVSQNIPMDLPDAATGQPPDAAPKQLAISLDREGKLYVDGTEVTWEVLDQRARAFASEEKEPRAVIAADRNVTHGQFIRVIDLLRNAGVSRYAINVNPEDAQREN